MLGEEPFTFSEVNKVRRQPGRRGISLAIVCLFVGCLALAASTRGFLSDRGVAAPSSPPVTPPAPSPAHVAARMERLTQAAESSVPPDVHTVKAAAVPILMYHVIGDGPNNLFVSEADFRAQMDYLAQAGYHTVSMEQLYRAFHSDHRLPEKPIVITFDDAYTSHYTQAFPVLRAHKFVGTFYVPTHLVGRSGHMTWEMVQQMDKAGMEIGAHTRSHVDVRKMNEEGLVYEILGSKQDLEQHLGHPVYGFCYPSGTHDAKSEAFIQEAGFHHATTTVFAMAQPSEDPFLYSRIRVSRGESVDGFAASLLEPKVKPRPDPQPNAKLNTQSKSKQVW